MELKNPCSNRCSRPIGRAFLLPLRLSLLIAAPAFFISLSGDGSPHSPFFSPPPAFAEQSWKAEFDEVCSKNDDAMSLMVDELKSLIQRCDKLKLRIEGLDETPRKVYLKRLQMCRDLYLFVLESKEQEKLQPSAASPGQK